MADRPHAGCHRHHQRHQRCPDGGERDRDHRCRRQRDGRDPGWALALNDTDPDTIDHLSLGNITTSSGGSAVKFFGDAFFGDDATLGGSFNYRPPTERRRPPRPQPPHVVNNVATAAVLNGTGGDDILHRHQRDRGPERRRRQRYPDRDGGRPCHDRRRRQRHLRVPSAADRTRPDHAISTTPPSTTGIAISASSFGGGLTAGMDVTFETSGDDAFSGFSQFHFDTGNQTLLTTAPTGPGRSAVAVVSVQSGRAAQPARHTGRIGRRLRSLEKRGPRKGPLFDVASVSFQSRNGDDAGRLELGRIRQHNGQLNSPLNSNSNKNIGKTRVGHRMKAAITLAAALGRLHRRLPAGSRQSPSKSWWQRARVAPPTRWRG